MKLQVLSVGLLGPGLASWPAAQAVLRAEAPHEGGKTKLLPPARLPAAERRRAGDAIKLAMAVADEAVSAAGIDPQTLATVFASSSGEGMNCHSICETLASDNRLISPTRFTNSVHNAPSGYWHIAVASRAPSTSLCAFDGSFAAGLIEAACQTIALQAPVLLVASDTPYPEPLHATRALPDSFGVALLLTAQPTTEALANLQLSLVDSAGAAGAAGRRARADVASPPCATPGAGTVENTFRQCAQPSLETLRRNIPAAHALPLLQLLARMPRAAGGAVFIDYLPGLGLQAHVSSARP